MKKTLIKSILMITVILLTLCSTYIYASEPVDVKTSKKASMMNGLVDVIKNNNISTIFDKNTNNENQENFTSIFDVEAEDKKIKIYFHREDCVRTLNIEEYVLGVLAAEMSSSRHEEALKAQAVAIRTLCYYYSENPKKHPDGAVLCTDSGHCQSWILEDYDSKYVKAVEETEGTVIKYQGEYIISYYFCCSGGYTENFENVWRGDEKPYLVSVPSPGEASFNEYHKLYNFTEKNFAKLLGIKGAAFKNISDVVRSDSGRILTLKINGVELTGKELRGLLGLRSTNAYFSIGSDGEILISVFGYGHGVGMSQCGAEAMARTGSDYIEILTHYYTNVTIGIA